jgi:nucleoside-diphosphate-sugar epimerase
MIIGNGMLASCFQKIENSQTTFFCSGVSNSTIEQKSEFMREEKLLLSMPKESLLVYTSTLSIYFNSNPYQIHKLKMEELIKDKFKNHLILRVGNLVGKNQKQWQLLPSLINQIKNGSIKIKKCKRDILDTSDYVDIVALILNEKGTFNISTSYSPFVSEIVEEIEKILKSNCKKEFIDCIENFNFQPDFVINDNNYYKKAIKKAIL